MFRWRRARRGRAAAEARAADEVAAALAHAAPAHAALATPAQATPRATPSQAAAAPAPDAACAPEPQPEPRAEAEPETEPQADVVAPLEVRLELYRRMAELRVVARRLHEADDGGRHGLGLEAIAAGFGLAMEAVDYCVPSCGCASHARACGAPVTELPAGVSPALASGAAWSARLRGSGQVVVCFVGHGAASAAAAVEAVELAAPCRLPVVFVYEHEGAAAGAADGAAGTGRAVAPVVSLAGGRAPLVVVDGDDAEAVYAAAVSALARARGGGGPSLVEALTVGCGGAGAGAGAAIQGRAGALAGDPLRRSRDRLQAAGVPAAQLDRLEEEAAGAAAGAAAGRGSLGLAAAGTAGEGGGPWPR